jgi:hypothetical protein
VLLARSPRDTGLPTRFHPGVRRKARSGGEELERAWRSDGGSGSAAFAALVDAWSESASGNGRHHGGASSFYRLPD